MPSLPTRDTALLPPATGAQIVLTTSLFLAPITVALLMRGGYSEQSAGALISAEIGISALTILFMSSGRWRHPLRSQASIGAAITLAGNLFSIVAPDFWSLLACRVLVGGGAGIFAAACVMLVARSRKPGRIFSLVTVSVILNGSLWLMVVPFLSQFFGLRTPFVCLSVVCALGLAISFRLPAKRLGKEPRKVIVGKPEHYSSGRFLLGATLLTQIGQGAFWAFVGTFGESAGVGSQTIGMFLSIANLLLIAGVIGSSWSSERFGIFRPLLILIAVNALSILLIATLHITKLFYLGNIFQALSNLSAVVLLLGLAASFDRSGRLVAAASGLVTLGNGFGPVLGGIVSSEYGAAGVGWFVLALNVLAIAALVIVSRTLARGAAKDTSPAPIIGPA